MGCLTISETLNTVLGMNVHFQSSHFVINVLIHSFSKLTFMDVSCVPGPMLISRVVKQR